jgi:hypothetical protein
MANTNLDKKVEEMKGIAEWLIPYTFPKVVFSEEQEVLPLKQRNVTLDGYEMVLCYSKADYDSYFLESLQVQSYYSPFLPFTLVCKLGRAFLGKENLSYIEFFRNSRKVYCWTIRSRDGRSLPPGNKTKPGSYEGFAYNILQPGTIDLF